LGSYSDFLRQHPAGSRVRRLYWVCGEEDMLRLLTVKRVRELCEAQDFNVVRLSARDTPETEIWASLNQHPLDAGEKRLIVIRDAQRLEHLDRMVSWIKDNQTVRRASATAVFVSEDLDLEDEEVRSVLVKSSSAAVVRCTLPKDEQDRLKRVEEVVCAWGNIDPINARLLALRVNFDMAAVYSVMWKASYFPDARVTMGAIEALVPRQPDNDVVKALMGMRKQDAIEAALDGGVDVSSVIGALASHLESLGRLNVVLANSKNAKEAAAKSRVREQYARYLFPYAKFYPRAEVARRTLLLTRMDAASRSGARDGVLEALIALW
jgi:DNA polymerase III delta subunit